MFNPRLNEFVVHLLQCFPDKPSQDIARLIIASQPELCFGVSHTAIYERVRRMRREASKPSANPKDIAIAQKIFQRISVPNKNPSPIDYERLKIFMPEKQDNAVQKKPLTVGGKKR